MDEFAAGQAAKWLGITEEATHKAAREGRLMALSGEGPRRFSRAALEEYHQARVRDGIAALARVRETPVSVAAKVRRALHKQGETGMPRSFAAKLAAMPIAWRTVFSTAELAAACVRDGEGCRWCRALEFADFKGLRPPEFSPALKELFGADPCSSCGPGLLAPYMAALAARVHAGDRRLPGPSPRPSAAEREAARQWAERRPVAAVARPVQDDGGRALVARRLREVRGKLKDAKRRGDQRYVLQLAQTVRALEADAARVDGRAPAAGRPGVLRCGHQLAAGCACPRRASKRATP